ncbi:MAG: shikimate dehydrogenase [Planctomycetaceae bacterium]|nr:shikimate dehydrogenase [Planctomycetaceae bacterium]
MTYLTIPICGKDLQSCKEQISSAVKAGVQMLELRSDYLESLDTYKLKGLMAEAKKTNLPIIVTCRDAKEGGQNNIPAPLRKQILVEAINNNADLIDCEFKNFTGDVEIEIKQALAEHKKTKLILSSHNFKEPFENLSEIYEEMYSVFPDAIAKTAYQANHINDCFPAFDILHEYGEKAIAICMGQAGIISRIIAKKLNAFLTFGSLDENQQTAPGQVSIETMKQLYRFDTINKDTELFGVIADPVGHSISPAVHNACFAAKNYNGVYLPMLVKGGNAEFDKFLNNITSRPWLNFKGFSVTIPHKVNALEYAQEKGEYIDPVAVQIGAVNTLTIGQNNRITGGNTDYAGAMDALTVAMGISRKQLNGKTVACLGAGGVARAIVAGLADVGAKITIYNRTMAKAQGLAREFKCHFAGNDELKNLNADIIINCTSIGMHPNVNESPLPAECLKPTQTVFDMVYNPIETLLIKQAKQAGAKTVCGAEMFIGQAAEQFKMFTQTDCPMDVMRKAVLEALKL